MYFDLTEDQQEFKRSVRKTIEKFGGLNIAKSLRLGVRNSYTDVLNSLNELGLSTIMISEQFGGAGLTPIEMMVAYEEFGKNLLPFNCEETYSFAVPLLEKYGTEKQKQLLKKIVNNEIRISLAIADFESQSFEKEAICTTVVQEGNDYVLNGKKTYVLDDGTANYYIVLARFENREVLVLVPNSSNITVERLDLYEEITTASIVHFNNVHLSKDDLLGEIGEGWKIYETATLPLLAAVSAHLVGVMEKIMEITVEYAKTREQFGSPIGRFQAIKHRLVDMKIDLELARSLSYYANWAVSTDSPDAKKAAYQAKAFICEKAAEVTSASILIHGAIGVTREADCHLFLKRAKFLESYLGNPTYYYEQIPKILQWGNEYDVESEIVQS